MTKCKEHNLKKYFKIRFLLKSKFCFQNGYKNLHKKEKKINKLLKSIKNKFKFQMQNKNAKKEKLNSINYREMLDLWNNGNLKELHNGKKI